MVATSSSHLPPSILAAIPGISWPLDPTLTPPLHFQSMPEMKSIRASSEEPPLTKNNNNGDSSSSSLDPALFRDIPATLETLLSAASTTEDDDEDDNNEEQRYFGWISIALLLLGHGYTDECHNLITPLSWPDDIHFAYGPSVYNSQQLSPAVKCYATYVHCLVHRREAFHVGEFGMVGFQNANFWSNAVAKSPTGGVESLPHAELLEQVATLAQDDKYRDNPFVQDWCQRHGMTKSPIEEESSTTSPYFESRAVHELCATVLQQQQQQTSSSIDNLQLKEFAERVAESEIRILLAHSLEKAGFGQIDTTRAAVAPTNTGATTVTSTMTRPTTTDDKSERTTTSSSMAAPVPKVDVDVAIRASRRVSSAHLSNFQSTGSTMLRKVIDDDDDDDDLEDKTAAVFSASAGVACRLLEAPAVRLLQRNEVVTSSSTDGERIVEVIASSDTSGEVEEGNGVAAAAGGGALALGDVLARLVTRQECKDDDSLVVLGGNTFLFASVTNDDDPSSTAAFVDPLFGTRGETPTSVIQWSKGTIH